MTDTEDARPTAQATAKTPDNEQASTHGHVAPENAQAFPPNDPVDVPNLPKAVKPAESAPAGKHPPDAAQSNPNVDTTKHSWADNTQPAPDKKNARSSIL